MKRLAKTLLAATAMLALVSCQGLLNLGGEKPPAGSGINNGTNTGTDSGITVTQVAVSSTLTSVPKSISVQVPTSLISTSPAARSLGDAARSGNHDMDGKPFGEGMGAHFWVKKSLWDTQKRLARGAATLVALDSIITADTLAPSATAVSGKSVKWSGELVDAVKALLPASFASNVKFKSEAKLPVVDSVKKVPDFVYSLVPDTDLVNSPTYGKMVTISSSGEGDTDTEVETRSFYWSDDKSKVKFDVTATETGTVVEQTFVAYDSATLAMAAGNMNSHGTMSLEIKADTAAADSHGTFLTYDSTINKGDGESDLARDGTVSISSSGYADDSGGTVTDTITVTSGIGIKVYYLKEEFDTAGKLTTASYSTDGTTYTVLIDPTTTSNPAEKKKYQDKADMAVPGGKENMGKLGDEVRNEIEKHGDEDAASPVEAGSGGGNPGSGEGSGGSGVNPTPPPPGAVTSRPQLYEIEEKGITKGVWIAASDAAFATTIGTGIAKEAGQINLSFVTAPKVDDPFWIAPLSNNTADATKAIELKYKPRK
ncbi:MAG: hypothetical protein ACOYM2_10655 [Rectinemataceae bacterium]